MSRFLRILGFVLIFISTIHSCSDRDSSWEVERRIQKRIRILTDNSIHNCDERIMVAAELRADSLLLVRARKLKQLSGRPPRPVRPGEEARRELSSPLPLRPLFPFEIRFDSLLRDSIFRDSIRLDSIERTEL